MPRITDSPALPLPLQPTDRLYVERAGSGPFEVPLSEIGNLLDAAPADHTHSLESLGAAAGSHTHTANQVAGLGPVATMTLAEAQAAVSGHAARWRMAALGNSIVAAGDGKSELYFSDSIQHYISGLSGGRIELVRNAGVAGETSTEILARFDADVAPWSPHYVYIMARTNDHTGGNSAANAITLTQSISNHVSLADKCRAIGAVPIFAACLPVTSASTNEKTENRIFNAWMQRYCRANNFPSCRIPLAVVDPATGTWPSAAWTANSGDGTHPRAVGQLAIAQSAIADLAGLPVAWERPAIDAGDPLNLVLNPLMLTDTAGLATSWAENGTNSATSRAYSIVTDPLVPGKMQRITVNEASGALQASLSQLVTLTAGTHYTAGDVLGVYLVSTLTDIAKIAGRSLQATLLCRVNGTVTSDYISRYGVGIPSGLSLGVEKIERFVMGRRFTLPSGVTSLRIFVQLMTGYQSGSSGGAGTLDFGGVRVVNLTRMGLA